MLWGGAVFCGMEGKRGGVSMVCLGAQLAPVCLTVCSFPPAMQQVLDNLGSLPNATGAAELDLIFLRGIMESPIVRSLAKVVCSREVDTRVLCLGWHSGGGMLATGSPGNGTGGIRDPGRGICMDIHARLINLNHCRWWGPTSTPDE